MYEANQGDNVANLKDVYEMKFEEWIVKNTISEGTEKVKFANILARFCKDMNMPEAKYTMGRLLKKRFMRNTQAHYYLNQQL